MKHVGFSPSGWMDGDTKRLGADAASVVWALEVIMRAQIALMPNEERTALQSLALQIFDGLKRDHYAQSAETDRAKFMLTLKNVGLGPTDEQEQE